MITYKRTIIVFLIFILILLLYIYGQVKGGGEVVVVKTTLVQKGTIQQLVSSFGTVKAKEVNLSFTPSLMVSGRLGWIGAKEGQVVKAGQDIARLDTYPAAKGEFYRIRKLYKQGIISRQNYEQSKVKFESYYIQAPFKGVISAKHLEIGEVVGGFLPKPVFTLVDFDSIWVEIDIDESDINKIYSGQSVKIYSDTYKDEVFTGKVAWVNRNANRSDANQPTLGEAEKVFKARVNLILGKNKLKPGMSVQVEIIISEKSDVLVVPRQAISYNQENKDIVFIVKGNKVEIMPVELGIKEASKVEVVSGLKPGEQIAINNLDKLHKKSRVWVKK